MARRGPQHRSAATSPPLLPLSRWERGRGDRFPTGGVGEGIEDYPALHRPLPDCLLLTWLTTPIPVHAVIALDQDRILLVTVYQPSNGKMTGKLANNSRCPLCGGRLIPDQHATIPFVLGRVVVVVKDVPAEVCRSCGEPYLTGAATDQMLLLLRRFVRLPIEVSVASYAELTAAEPVAA